jgi:multidrug efflux pump subunit AcrB
MDGSDAVTFNLSALATRYRAVTLFALAALALGGVWSYLSLGRAEDPGFTIKEMVILADWPGADAAEMARLVADPIERKLQDLDHLDFTESQTQPGHTAIRVTLRDDTPVALVSGLFYQVRKKIGDIRGQLPDTLQGPYFNDEFGDTYGIVYALTSDDFSLSQLRHVAEDVREQLIDVPGTGRVVLFGQPNERITIEVSHRKLAQLGLTLDALLRAVRMENSVVANGFVDTPNDRIQVRTRHVLDGLAALEELPVQVKGHLLRLGDIADIHRGAGDPPAPTMRFNGHPAIGLGIVMADGGNIVDLGKAMAARVASIAPGLPMGIHLATLNDQPVVVTADVGDFQESFLEALAIVLLVSFVSLGLRAGIVVAISVPLVLAGVFVGMMAMGIALQRISLGAMVIALGLLVDDAIIAVETMSVKLRQGWSRTNAGSFAFTSTAFPMLTGTLVTAAGYMPVGLAQSSTGEYTQDIFRVVGLALILSWFVAVLFVPFLGMALLPGPRPTAGQFGTYDGRQHALLRRMAGWCVHHRYLVIAAALLAFIASATGFILVPQQFFPTSDRREVLIDLRLPEGASFAATEAAVKRMEAMLGEQSGIVSYAAYTGTGTPRFFLSFSPELDQTNFAQFVINTRSIADRDALFSWLSGIAARGASGPFPDVRLRPSLLEFGPPVGYPVQFRVVGPDIDELRRIGAQAADAMRTSKLLTNINSNWDAMAKTVTVRLDQNKARLLGLSTEDAATTLQTLQQGSVVTQFREGTDLIPVVVRSIPAERTDIGAIGDITVPSSAGQPIPLAQFAEIGWGLEQPEVWHRNRTPMMVLRADTLPGVQPEEAVDDVLPRLARITASLPSGYRIETAGAVEESAKGSDSINKILPAMVLVILALLMIQLRSFQLMAIVLLTAPLGLIGVTAALLITGAPFGFVAMLGFIALAGIIMRNSVILVDQIEQDIAAGVAVEEAIVEATVRRARPILLTAAAAILGLAPLAFSVFWGPMAIAIMGGLVSATALTLCFVPSLFAAMRAGGHRLLVREPAPAEAGRT